MELKPYSCLIDIDDMGSTRVDLSRDQRGKTLEASLWYDCIYPLSTSLALVYIMHQRPRLTRVLAEYAGGEKSLS